MYANLQKREANLKQKKDKDAALDNLRAKQASKSKQTGNRRIGRKIMGRVFLEDNRKESKVEITNEEDLEDEKYFV
jgi:hypothetical protein